MLSRRDLLAGVPGLLLAGRATAHPSGDKDLIVRLEDPFCAEAPLETLADDWMTPLRRLYVLNHGELPHLRADHQIAIDGMVRRRLRFSVPGLVAQFRPVTAPATLVCAGNRRTEHGRIEDPLGWGAGAVGNAWWTGVPLHEVLAAAPCRRCGSGGRRQAAAARRG